MLKQLLVDLFKGKKVPVNTTPAGVLSPKEIGALLNQALQLHQSGQYEKAEPLYVEIIESDASNVDALHLLGLVKHSQNKNEEAIPLLEQALKINPLFIVAQVNLAVMLRSVMRYDEALSYFNKALMGEPNNLEALHNRGHVLLDLKNPQKALNDFNQYLNVIKNNADVFSSKAAALHALDRYEESLEYYDQAIKLNKNKEKYHFEKGNVLRELKFYDQAIECYNNAIDINPDYAVAHNNKAMTLLSINNFEKGWALYEWRSKLENINVHPIKITNEWNGKKMAGSLLVLSEQGLGDEIFYSGMLNDLYSLADKITVCVDPRLISLYQRSFEQFEFISTESPINAQAYDAQIYMASLGRYFRASGQAVQDNVKIPYLKACPEKTKSLRSLLPEGKKLICGLSWISKNADCGVEKTLTLHDLKSVLSLPDIDFVDIQYGNTDEEQAAFYVESGISLTRIPDIDNLQDIDGLAALIDACDIVLTISNTTAHLAGALGKPVIIMLPYAKGLFWYWHDGHHKNPWYATAKLFKQTKSGDWADVINRVELTLELEIDGCQK